MCQLMNTIPTYAINLEKRTDRKANIFAEFNGRSEFTLTIVPAVEHIIGAIGLWSSILTIIQKEKQIGSEYILICEDDHQFTKEYKKESIFGNINKAKNAGADILLGGVSWFGTVLQISEELFWVDCFNATQFMIIFKKFYNKLLESKFTEKDNADFKISSLSDNIMIMYPFISTQKEFGYSDVTKENGEEGRVTTLFTNKMEKLTQLQTVTKFYKLTSV